MSKPDNPVMFMTSVEVRARLASIKETHETRLGLEIVGDDMDDMQFLLDLIEEWCPQFTREQNTYSGDSASSFAFTSEVAPDA